MTTVRVRLPEFLTLTLGAIAIILAGAIFKVSGEALTMSVIAVGSTIIFVWFRNVKPNAWLRKGQVKALLGVGTLSLLATVIVLVRYISSGWYWGCALAIFPIYLGIFCFRYFVAAAKSERATEESQQIDSQIPS